MAERRMFAKTIVTSDAFLDMPTTSRCLYFTLGVMADDDGFVNNPRSIMRQIGATNDDMNILIAKKYVIIFESGVVVIKHWRIHNYIQKDRYQETKYVEEKSQLFLDENNAYTLNPMSAREPIDKKEKPKLTEAREKRYKAKKESDLPYSFDYKIKTAFVGERCPICGCVMDYSSNLTKPTIQHNIPISKGGKHEIGNISVICEHCNTSIQNREITGDLNNALVREKWECIGNVSGMDTQDRLGKDRIEIGKDIYKERSTAQCADDEKDFAINEMVYNVITYLNQRTGSKFRHNNPKTITLIKGRMKENYTLEDFKKVIDNKIEDWTGTEFAKHLNPETLFCAKHFETYLNAEIIKPIKPGHFGFERTYTKAEMDALIDNIDDIEL